jgi:hypothetical protein
MKLLAIAKFIRRAAAGEFAIEVKPGKIQATK